MVYSQCTGQRVALVVMLVKGDGGGLDWKGGVKLDKVPVAELLFACKQLMRCADSISTAAAAAAAARPA